VTCSVHEQKGLFRVFAHQESTHRTIPRPPWDSIPPQIEAVLAYQKDLKTIPAWQHLPLRQINFTINFLWRITHSSSQSKKEIFAREGPAVFHQASPSIPARGPGWRIAALRSHLPPAVFPQIGSYLPFKGRGKVHLPIRCQHCDCPDGVRKHWNLRFLCAVPNSQMHLELGIAGK
jgi:hypothetical protein